MSAADRVGVEVVDGALLDGLIKQTYMLTQETSTATAALLAELDLTEPLATALWRLDPDGPPPPMRTLAAMLRCDPSTATFLVDRLEERGLVLRQAAPTDRRIKVIALTAAGKKTRTRLVDGIAARSPLARLTAAQQEQLSRLLKKAGLDPAHFMCCATMDVDSAASSASDGGRRL
jgi:DNA-binding MarR family transcriptional regulator